MKIYAIVNQKGGVGKTTSVISLGAYLAEKFRVLIIDIDPQANATSGMGLPRDPERASTYDLLLKQATGVEIIYSHPHLNLDILPASADLAPKVDGTVDRAAVTRCRKSARKVRVSMR